MSELKPCPFCGGKVEASWYYLDRSRKVRWCVYCPACDLFVENRDATEKGLAEAWNMRAKDGEVESELTVEERKTGRWVIEEGMCVEYRCSVCEKEALHGECTFDYVLSKFCPTCGARMEGEG